MECKLTLLCEQMTDKEFKEAMETTFGKNQRQTDMLFRVLRLAIAGGLMTDLLQLLKDAQIASLGRGKLSVEKLNAGIKLLEHSVALRTDVNKKVQLELFGPVHPFIEVCILIHIVHTWAS